MVFMNLFKGKKSGTKIFLLMLGLMLPYMGFVLYRVFAYPQHPFPNWFLYVGPCYFFGSIALLVVLRKKFVGNAPPQDLDKQRRSAVDIKGNRRNLKWLWVGVGLYSLIFLNGLRLSLPNAGEVPLVAVILGDIVNGAILTALIVTLRKVYKRVQPPGLVSDADRNQEL